MSVLVARPSSDGASHEGSPTAGDALHRLDGLTLLRFALAHDTGGGVESHLRELNRILGERNRLTTLQIQLTAASGLDESVETIGGSTLVKVPLRSAAEEAALLAGSTSSPPRSGASFAARLLDAVVRTPALNAHFARLVSRWRAVPHRQGSARGAGRKAADLLRRFHVDLVVLHAAGGGDASEVIDAARAAGVPVVLVHHFANDLLGGTSLRQQVARLAAVGGASRIGLPAYLRTRFCNLSDAVDLAFYDRAAARPVEPRPASPVLFAPGRITPEKGQMEVLEVARRLVRRGLDFIVVFAGRVDDPEFDRRLRAAAAAPELDGRVVFAGQLTLERYRDWYGAACLTLMPTRHLEGMPRTLIESAAMKVPPLVYAIGGTPEGVRDGETGCLLRLGDVSGMAEAAERLLRDAALRDRMAEAGRAFVERAFSLAAFAARHETFYLAALQRRRPGERRSPSPTRATLAEAGST